MFRMWARLYSDGHILRDMVVEKPEPDMSRTAKVFAALEAVCTEFDLAKPIWFDKNVKEFKRLDKTTFNHDNFIEAVAFDKLLIEVIEEDGD